MISSKWQAGRQAGVGVKQAEPGSHRLGQEHSRRRKLQRDDAPGEKDQPAAHNSCIFPHDPPCVQCACDRDGVTRACDPRYCPITSEVPGSGQFSQGVGFLKRTPKTVKELFSK